MATAEVLPFETVVAGIAATVEKQPEATALIWEANPALHSNDEAPRSTETRLDFSYRQLWNAANAAAVRLRDMIPPEAWLAKPRQCPHLSDLPPRLGLMVSEGPALAIIEMAALLSGLAIVPLDPNDTPQRIAYVLQDAQPAVVVTNDDRGTDVARAALKIADIVERKVSYGKAVITVQASEILQDSAPWRSSGINNLQSLAEAECAKEEPIMLPSWGVPAADTISHIFFTSGSTGRPKGCIATHGNLAHYAAAKIQVHSIDNSSVTFVASSHTFDPSLGDFVSAWCCGATVAIASRRATFSSLGACLAVTCATHVSATPSIFSTLPDSGWGPVELPDLKVVALGGEAMPKSVAQVWGSNVTLLNTYGVTECCVYQASSQISPGIGTRTLGHALPGGTALLLVAGEGDDPEVLVQDGSGNLGEIWIAGPQVGLGYLNRPELTQERFVKGPAHLGMCFRTGDIARAAPKGWEIVGRRDSQVKLNGQRIELGEIEEVLLTASRDLTFLRCELLQACAVVLSKESSGDGRSRSRPQLVAWCVPSCNEGYGLKSDSLQNEKGCNKGSGPESAIARAITHDAQGQDNPEEWAMSETANREALAVLETLLRRLVSSHLPNHMIPARFIAVESLPTTANGKVARSKLAVRAVPHLWDLHSAMSTEGIKQIDTNSDDDESSTQNTTQEEDTTHGWGNIVAEIWQDELGIPLMPDAQGVKNQDQGAGAICRLYRFINWQTLGGDSLGALRCCQRISARLRAERNRISESANTIENHDQNHNSNLRDSEGEFGELLGPLAPAELLQRPNLHKFCQHLAAELGPFPHDVHSSASGTAQTPSNRNQRGPSMPSKICENQCQPLGQITSSKHQKEDPLITIAYSAAAAGAIHVLHAILRTPEASTGVDPIGRCMPPGYQSGTALRCASLLHTAAAQGHLYQDTASEVVKILIAAGSPLNIPDQSGATPLHHAVRRGPAGMVKALLEAGALLVAYDDSKQTPLHHAARADPPLAVWKLLLDGLEDNHRKRHSAAGFSSAKENKGRQKARGIGHRGSRSGLTTVDCRDKWDRTPLHWATVNGHGKAVGVLLEAGADSKAVDAAGETPLQIAERRAQCGAKDRGGARASVFGAIATQLGGSAKTIKGDKSQLFGR